MAGSNQDFDFETAVGLWPRFYFLNRKNLAFESQSTSGLDRITQYVDRLGQKTDC